MHVYEMSWVNIHEKKKRQAKHVQEGCASYLVFQNASVYVLPLFSVHLMGLYAKGEII